MKYVLSISFTSATARSISQMLLSLKSQKRPAGDLNSPAAPADTLADVAVQAVSDIANQLRGHQDHITTRMTGANEVSKAINKPTPGQPRQIRAQVGLTEDPLPEGKSVAEPEHHHKVEPASHGATDQTELSKDEVKDHKEELQHMQAKEQKFQSAANAVDKHAPQKSAATGKAGRESRQ